MCFEFEALYWAKLAEEEEKRKEVEKQREAAKTKSAKPQAQPVYDEDPLPV
jgi:hypothetical protein